MRAALPTLMAVIVMFACTATASAQPSRDALARARAEAEAMIRPSGPVRAVGRIAFEPVPPPPRRFAGQYDRYIYSLPVGSYCGYGLGYGFGWGFGFGWARGCGSFGVGASIYNGTTLAY